MPLQNLAYYSAKTLDSLNFKYASHHFLRYNSGWIKHIVKTGYDMLSDVHVMGSSWLIINCNGSVTQPQVVKVKPEVCQYHQYDIIWNTLRKRCIFNFNSITSRMPVECALFPSQYLNLAILAHIRLREFHTVQRMSFQYRHKLIFRLTGLTNFINVSKH